MHGYSTLLAAVRHGIEIRAFVSEQKRQGNFAIRVKLTTCLIGTLISAHVLHLTLLGLAPASLPDWPTNQPANWVRVGTGLV